MGKADMGALDLKDRTWSWWGPQGQRLKDREVPRGEKDGRFAGG